MKFACMAEAVAHFFNGGYVTEDTREGYRLMRFCLDRNCMVELKKTGFLMVEATFLIDNETEMS
jgi:hypothetical protein